jgi:aminopeptidase N
MKFLFILSLFWTSSIFGQFTSADSIRGGYGSTRNWWDITHFDLAVTFQLDQKEISGSNTITFDILPLYEPTNQHLLQIDLQDPLHLDSVVFNNEKIATTAIQKNGAAYFITLPSSFKNNSNSSNTIQLFYHGKPREAVNAPWDGGIVWKKDSHGKPWVSIACQGLGASCWFPCKESQIDEPQNGVSLHFTIPDSLTCISNGSFLGATNGTNGMTTFNWNVTQPINNYCVIPYIGDYVNMHDHFQGEKGNLEVDYWVLRGHETQAAKQFAEVPRTLKAFEYWFGAYPFYEDGYKLVEAPYLGMEHQSAVAYGNRFQNGYLGTDLSGTGIGLKWDFIIVHETGHEWFGNSITSNDIADMWIHESFTCYSETLFTEYWFGKEAGDTYCIGIRKKILNDIPIIGHYQVNNEGSGDMYYKGANMLHLIRMMVNNDSVFRNMLRNMNTAFYHQNVSTKEIEQFMSHELHIDLAPIFDCYLRSTHLPILQLSYHKDHVRYRWKNMPRDFKMLIHTDFNTLKVTSSWQKLTYQDAPYLCIPNSYYLLKEVKTTKAFQRKIAHVEYTTCP